MTLPRLVWRNIVGNGFRSLAIGLCAALIAAMALTATFVVRGAEESLRSNLEQLGADILVLPWGTMTEKLGGVKLMSAAIDGWMPQSFLEKIEGVEGVAQVSPQLHLGTLIDSPYGTQSALYLVAYDPATDFVLDPWLEGEEQAGVGVGEAIVGAAVTREGATEEVTLFGSDLVVAGRLEPTATTIDQSVFVSFETAEAMAAQTNERGEPSLVLLPGAISAVMVRLDLGSDAHGVAVQILESVPGVVPLETPNLFQTARQQTIGVLRTVLGMLGTIWVLVIVFMGLVFSIAVNARRWEIGVLRALGFPQVTVLRALLLEGVVLALAGGLSGALAAGIGLSAFEDMATVAVGLPLSIPSLGGMMTLCLQGQLAALGSVIVAALLPAWRISYEEVALTMRE